MNSLILVLFQPDNQALLIFSIVLITTCFFGGVLAGIATLIITRKIHNFSIEIIRILIGAIAGYESVLIWSILSLKNKNSNEIIKAIVYHNQIFPGFFLLFISSIFGALGASIAIFLMRKLFRWR